jgi:hypothetical protein
MLTVSLVRASTKQIPFVSSVFDTIVMTLDALFDTGPCVSARRNARVLKPGGYHDPSRGHGLIAH